MLTDSRRATSRTERRSSAPPGRLRRSAPCLGRGRTGGAPIGAGIGPNGPEPTDSGRAVRPTETDALGSHPKPPVCWGTPFPSLRSRVRSPSTALERRPGVRGVWPFGSRAFVVSWRRDVMVERSAREMSSAELAHALNPHGPAGTGVTAVHGPTGQDGSRQNRLARKDAATAPAAPYADVSCVAISRQR